MASEFTVDTLRILAEQRFTSLELAVDRKSREIDRRLDDSNHAAALAREKERDFVSREAFDLFTQRTAEDFIVLRREIQAASSQAATVRETTALTLAGAHSEQIARIDARFAVIESLQAKMLGGLLFGVFIVPVIMGGVYYLLTKSG